ncbi:mycothiol synthase [Dietzia sp. ANT_WB102]|uniref:mycothiol synthase n=1 Tax=Dietzia sp. ANT_WB102 TaxID=2597345 RepID=UPI0011EF797F|nr:mycothiol synthase [Dietzia sp. ANT_WB102]KAA0916484.1 mycothiol synthase [Dietzia sp. ANT_WB102]
MTVTERAVDVGAADRIEAMAGIAESVDGVAPLGEQPLRALRGPAGEVRHFLASDPAASESDAGGPSASPSAGDPAIVGYAQLTGTGDEATVEMVVDPEHRRRGHGSALLRAVFNAEPRAAVWAHGDLTAARALAENLGLARTRELLKMRRRAADGPTLPEPRASEGIETGALADAASEGGSRWAGMDARDEFLRVNNAAFSWHPEQGGWTREQLDDRLAVDWVDPGAVFLAVDTSGEIPRLAGFHWTKTVAEPGKSIEGEVYVVAVDPADQGRGLGGLLTAIGVAHLESTVGAESVVLYVEGDNLPAIRTYERLGFAVEHRDVTYASR